MVYHGFCDKQKKNYSVEFRKVSSSTLEDEPNKFEKAGLSANFQGLLGVVTTRGNAPYSTQ